MLAEDVHDIPVMNSSPSCLRLGRSQVKNAIRRIQKALDDHQIMVDEHNSVQIGISIGTVSCPEDGRQPDLLLMVADQAMYKNKFNRRKKKKFPSGVIHFDRDAG
jgi:diguanylate cyclase (GGDEF)-like protein